MGVDINTENHAEPLSPSRFSRGRNAAWIACVALVYFVAARLSLLLAFQPEGIAAVWPPAGIFLSALLLTRRHLRIYLVGVLCLTDFAAEWLAGTPFFVSIAYSLALTGDAVLSAWLLLRFVGAPLTFARVRDVLGFLVLSVILSNGLFSLVAAAASRLLAGTSSFWDSWQWSAASDGVGNLLATPLIMSWASWAKRRPESWSSKRTLEGAALFLPLVLLNSLVFSRLPQSRVLGLLLAYVTVPFLLWAALRFGVRGVTSALVLLAAVAVPFAALNPLSDFPLPGSPLSIVIGVQLYLALLAIPSLFLVAVVTERREFREALRASEERFRIIATNTPDHIVMQDANLRYVWVINPQLGLTEKDMIGKTDFDILAKEEAEKLTRIKKEVLASGRPVPVELPLRRDGRVEYYDGSYVPIPGPGGTAVGLVGYFKNVTEQKRTEEALRESETRLNKAQEIAHLGSWELDLSTGRLTWSDEVYRIFGLPPQDFGATYEAFLDTIHPDDRTAVDEAYFRSLREGRDTYEIEHRIVRKPTGEIRYVQERCEHVRDASHRVVRSIGMVHDITERKQAEKSLQFTQFAIDHAADAAFWITEDAHFFYVNEAACQSLGYSREELLRMTVFDIDPAFTPSDWRRSWDNVKARKTSTFETVHRSRDGRTHPVEIRANYLEFGGRAYHCVFARDITERKRAEEALRDLNAKLESKVAQRTTQLQQRAAQLQKLTLELSQAEERERRRVAMVLHEDLQQQMAGAKFQVGLVKQRVRHDPALYAAVVRIDQMLKDAIDKSRGLSIDLSPAVLHVNCLAETLHFLAGRMCERHGLTVRVHVPPGMTLQSESLAMFLFRATQELLFNVVKHAQVNEAEVCVRRIGACLCLCVSDRGRGFDPRSVKETAGLGLLSIRERVELLGGRMTIKSAEGQGSAFRIVVPDKGES